MPKINKIAALSWFPFIHLAIQVNCSLSNVLLSVDIGYETSEGGKAQIGHTGIQSLKESALLFQIF